MKRRSFAKLIAVIFSATAAFAVPPTLAQPANTLKVGLILPLTGAFATIGKQTAAGVKLWVAQHPQGAAGKKIELIIRDDGGIADVSKRLAQELVVNEQVAVLAGFGLTPLALASAPVATQSKTPMVVMAAATASITDASPFVIRSGFTLPQVTIGIADWAPKNGIKKVVTMVADYGPGMDAETTFKERFTMNGGTVIETVRIPLKNPDFSPFLQKARDARPDALFVFVPSGLSAPFMKQFSERGLAEAGIKLIGTGDVTDDDSLNDMGEPAVGVVTSMHYSAAHDSATNKKFVEAFTAANPGMRPNFMAVGGYDGMRVISNGLEMSKGAGGEALLAAMKGQVFESPRGPVLIDAQTRNVVQDVYIRRVEKVRAMGNQLYNVEFDVQRSVKSPGKPR